MEKLEAPELLFSKDGVYSLSRQTDKKIDLASKRLVILYQNARPELNNATQTMLDKLVNACKFRKEEVLYIYAGNGEMSLGEIQRTHAPEMVLILGNVPPSRNAQLLLKNHPYEMNGAKVIRTDAPEKLEGNEREKTALWRVLKNCLNL